MCHCLGGKIFENKKLKMNIETTHCPVSLIRPTSCDILNFLTSQLNITFHKLYVATLICMVFAKSTISSIKQKIIMTNPHFPKIAIIRGSI